MPCQRIRWRPMPLSALVPRPPVGSERTPNGVVGTFKERGEVLSWLAATMKGQAAVDEAAAAGPTFRELADEWVDGVHSGAVGRRRGKKGAGYSPTTLDGYVRSLRYVLVPEFGARPASEIEDREWQTWIDRLSREGLSRSRIANHLAVARAIYGWASRPTRRLVERNPLVGVELPPNDERSLVRESRTPRRRPPSLPPCRRVTRCHIPSRSTPV